MKGEFVDDCVLIKSAANVLSVILNRDRHTAHLENACLATSRAFGSRSRY